MFERTLSFSSLCLRVIGRVVCMRCRLQNGLELNFHLLKLQNGSGLNPLPRVYVAGCEIGDPPLSIFDGFE